MDRVVADCDCRVSVPVARNPATGVAGWRSPAERLRQSEQRLARDRSPRMAPTA